MIEDSRKKYWSEIRSQFTESYEVPPLPIVDKKEWEDFYVPILIQLGAIPKINLSLVSDIMAVAEMHLLLYGWEMCLNINDINLGIHSQKK